MESEQEARVAQAFARIAAAFGLPPAVKDGDFDALVSALEQRVNTQLGEEDPPSNSKGTTAATATTEAATATREQAETQQVQRVHASSAQAKATSEPAVEPAAPATVKSEDIQVDVTPTQAASQPSSQHHQQQKEPQAPAAPAVAKTNKCCCTLL
ncbi:hypothetical protein PTSG_01792 [Salpingoeca rosetta]|uniref:Uncharacterized protein n=1 Tax=Salpingoeca rosetta (strain ATCC 50818 / BSB-021) TaxID=946362 RepID=F2TYZ3_SALR5|nr:uncharacterized protein PTSG_01792 [Salpingoeca rosetta]EGD78817.1 hypothetical protein PTSG_01792 [Salpingoeca rosetta]|eukprot:XP_004997773.1 hypothetical protein PTSG_01792 [Salpingoeca rosetta]